MGRRGGKEATLRKNIATVYEQQGFIVDRCDCKGLYSTRDLFGAFDLVGLPKAGARGLYGTAARGALVVLLIQTTSRDGCSARKHKVEAWIKKDGPEPLPYLHVLVAGWDAEKRLVCPWLWDWQGGRWERLPDLALPRKKPTRTKRPGAAAFAGARG